MRHLFSRELQHKGYRVEVLNLYAQEVQGFLWSLAASMGTNPGASDNTFPLWRQISDRVDENHLLGQNTVVLLDD